MLAEATRDVKLEKATAERPLFGVLGHGYQPPRTFAVELDLDDQQYVAGYSVIPEINDTITNQVYRPLLAEVEELPPGLTTSIYAPLRSYLKHDHPEIFSRIQEVVRNTPDREYTVIGDPLIHTILPLLPEDDQRMLFQAGRRAFENAFGFAPKGVWLPETAVSAQTLRLAAEAGYEFVPLRDDQVTFPHGENPDARHNICVIDVGGGYEIVAVLGNKGLSGYVSYDKTSTYNADAFMEGRQRIEQQNGWNSVMMMDLERYGHHQPGAEYFLKRALELVQQTGFSPLNMREVIEELKAGQREAASAQVRDFSSWSCEHGCGRWIGTCNCGEFGAAPPEIIADRKMLYETLRDMNQWVSARLDARDIGWRSKFTDFLVENHDAIFTGENFAPAIEAMTAGEPDDMLKKLYLAKTEILTGLTSCGWFFGNVGALERTIPASMITGVQGLFQEDFAQKEI